MSTPFLHSRRAAALGLSLALLPPAAVAAQPGWDHVAAFGGASVVGGKRQANILQVLAAWRLPDWRGLQLRWEVMAGALDKPGHDSAGLLATGAEIGWRASGSTVTWTLGSAGTLLSEHDYATIDYGGTFQFTSHVGARMAIDEHWQVLLRLQHTSNADIYDSNPGLDTAVLGLSRSLGGP